VDKGPYLFAVPSSKVTGVSQPTLSLACSLRAMGREVSFLCRGGSLAQEAQEGGIKVYPFSLSSLLRHGKRARAVITSRSQDHWWSILMWGLVKPVYRLWYRAYPPGNLPWNRLLACLTSGVFSPFVPLLSWKGKVHWLPGGVDPDVFFPPKGVKGAFSVVMVSRMKLGRGQERLLEAMARIPVSIPVTFKGGGEVLGRVETLARGLGVQGQCRWVPREVEGYPAFLRGYHLLVYLSVGSEATARTVLEAMASGLAVLAVPRGGIPFILSPWSLSIGGRSLEGALAFFSLNPLETRKGGLLNARWARRFSLQARMRRFLKVVEGERA
jgi:glycosyltransferase involved in cell wall biosynthesis